MDTVTIYLSERPEWPERGFRTEGGDLRIGVPWDSLTHSRKLTAQEVDRVVVDTPGLPPPLIMNGTSIHQGTD